MNELELSVRKIFESSNGFSRVSVNADVFKALAGFNPSLPYTTARTSNGKGVRVYNINGTAVYTQYDSETKKTYIIMKSEDAKKKLKSLDEERSSGPVVGFAFA